MLQVAGLLAPEEVDKALADVEPWAAGAGWPATREGLWAALVSRVRDCLHLVLTLSPVGDAFRARCAQQAAAARGPTCPLPCPWPGPQ
jgi:dynein heavy chain